MREGIVLMLKQYGEYDLYVWYGLVPMAVREYLDCELPAAND